MATQGILSIFLPIQQEKVKKTLPKAVVDAVTKGGIPTVFLPNQQGQGQGNPSQANAVVAIGGIFFPNQKYQGKDKEPKPAADNVLKVEGTFHPTPQPQGNQPQDAAKKKGIMSFFLPNKQGQGNQPQDAADVVAVAGIFSPNKQ